jgi:hypothetical protein
VVALILLQLLPIASSGERPLVDLQYRRGSGAEKCPDQRVLRQLVIERLGYDPFKAPAERRVSVEIEAAGGALVAKLSVASREGDFLGVQRLAGAPVDCRDLAQALSLALSLAIDPRSLDEAAEPAPEPQSSRSPVLSVARPRTPAVVPQDSWRALVGISASLGSAPEPGVGVRAGAQFRSRQFSFELEARADLPSGAQALGGSFATSLLVAEVAPCYRPVWTIDLCALALGGVEVSTDSGEVERHSSADPYAAVGGRLSAEVFSSGPLALRLTADAVAPFVRRRFIVDLPTGPGQIWNTPPVQGVLALDALLGI